MALHGMQAGDPAFRDNRREDRDEVHYRTRAIAEDGRQLQLLVVNLSPHGLMARCEAAVREGERLEITLPGAGRVAVEIRWVLGGRIGCQFERPVPRAQYYELIAILLR